MRYIGLTAIAMILAAASAASAAETATATISQTGMTGSNFDYSIVLKDTGTTNIGTFWYAWVPGLNFMALPEVSTTNPTGWAGNPQSGGGYSIQWVANTPSSDILPGGSLTFAFVSPSNFAAITGNSVNDPSFPVGTSFIYSGGPFSDAGTQFVVAAPEPASASLLGVGGIMVLKRRRR